jgi:hypothetical protein
MTVHEKFISLFSNLVVASKADFSARHKQTPKRLNIIIGALLRPW